MTGIPRRTQLADLAAAARLAPALIRRERWPLEQLRAYQQERLEAIVHHAVAHSPLYRERLGEALASGSQIALSALPVMTRAEMMSRFDDLVCDRRLRAADLLAALERDELPQLHAGAYRVMTTSGSSGTKGLFVYDRGGWRALIAQFLRSNAWMGVRPGLPRLKVAAIVGASATHMTRQVSATVGAAGIHRVIVLSASARTADLVDALNRFEPEYLAAYPSVAMVLAGEQIAGRLRLKLTHLSTSSELRTQALTDRLMEAFGVQPFDMYGTTEGLWGMDCEHHGGIHLFTDMTLVENVDEDAQPVDPGTPGARLLVTNLANRVQPIIRLDVSDAMTLAAEPCACGRTLPRAAAIAGRSDDVLELPATGGGTVTVPPISFAIIGRDRGVSEFQVVEEGRSLRILVVTRPGADTKLESRLAASVTRHLADLGVESPEVSVERRDELPRSPAGKLQMIVADRGLPV